MGVILTVTMPMCCGFFPLLFRPVGVIMLMSMIVVALFRILPLNGSCGNGLNALTGINYFELWIFGIFN
jgi:hypothetical protein